MRKLGHGPGEGQYGRPLASTVGRAAVNPDWIAASPPSLTGPEVGTGALM